jgi:hypothetical protein
MGYTDTQTSLLIGLVPRPISDAETRATPKNEKGEIEAYKRLANDGLPFFRGHVSTRERYLILRR